MSQMRTTLSYGLDGDGIFNELNEDGIFNELNEDGVFIRVGWDGFTVFSMG